MARTLRFADLTGSELFAVDLPRAAIRRVPTAEDRKDGTELADTIERIRWRLWNGQVRRGLDLIGDTMATLEATAEIASPAGVVARKVSGLLGDLETYVSGQSDIIIDYARARRRREPISTAITESTVLTGS
jgi:hypothetical protein